jgi:hypothetical protein
MTTKIRRIAAALAVSFAAAAPALAGSASATDDTDTYSQYNSALGHSEAVNSMPDRLQADNSQGTTMLEAHRAPPITDSSAGTGEYNSAFDSEVTIFGVPPSRPYMLETERGNPAWDNDVTVAGTPAPSPRLRPVPLQ